MQDKHLDSKLSTTRMISIALIYVLAPGILNAYAKHYYGIKRKQVFDDNNVYRQEWRKHAKHYKGEASEIKVIAQDDYGLE